jgi:predicted hydrocarbon binding protein/KaiC/GvpD/RAD55 family RecA-like ATPase
MQGVRVSLADIQDTPRNSLVLLSGPPGAGKSTFCHQAVLSGLAMDKPVIFVTTEKGPAEIVGLLRERGMGELAPAALSFVDAFDETVGVATPERPDTIHANCVDLNSISIATTRLQERMGQRGILLAFDSLTSPYLFGGAEVIKFMRLFLSKFAAEGNSVVALMDEGCGKPEDLVAMMSVADGVIKMEMEKDGQLLNVVKHPKVRPTTIEVPVEPKPTIKSAFDAYRSTARLDPGRMRQWVRSMSAQGEAPLRREVGDFVNLFWASFARWSSILWDPKRFPTMIYELNEEDAASSTAREMWPFYPRRERLLMKGLPSMRALGLFPKNFSKVRDMRKLSKQAGGGPWGTPAKWERSGSIEYLADISKTDEHYFRVHESSDCRGFENVGAAMASHLPPHMAGRLKGLEKDGGDWKAVETKCIGLGDPYCEFKLVPGEIDELRDSLEKDSSVIERIHGRLMDRLMEFLLEGKPLVERPRFGSDVHLHPVVHGFGFPYLALGGDRYRMALRMGGAKAGKEMGERLMEAGIKEDEAIKRVIDFMNYCKVGKVTMDETIRIKENCESLASWLFTTTVEPSCFFTTGFLNGLFSAVKGQHVREAKCVAAGDPYCEWEII